MLLRAVLAMEKQHEQRIRRLVARSDALLETVENPRKLWERVTRKSADVLLATAGFIQEEPDPKKVSIMRELPDAPYIVALVQRDDAAQRARYLAIGIDAVLALDLSDRQLKPALQGIFKTCRERAQKMFASRPRVAEPSFSDFVSRSPIMKKFMTVATKVADSDSSLLILGETGVGKERLTRAIHAESRRSKGPFIAVNCAALSESLLESELFGHEEGAFTGATRSHRGCFELAHRGVIFLDEIGELPNHLQVKLLRVLQERQITRVGSEQPFEVDVRLMAATNRDPREEVKARRLREDLYYRLNVVTLTIPPLRQRSEDIPDLVASYLTWLRPRVGRVVTGIAPEAMEALVQYSWPGNVRELINVIERAMLLCEGEQIRLADLPDTIRSPDAASLPDRGSLAGSPFEKTLEAARREIIERFERAYLAHHLKQCAGRVGDTAKRIGIEPRSLFDKMKRYGFRKEDFRNPSSIVGSD
jgi:DNA-binding NtrC family response regulator